MDTSGRRVVVIGGGYAGVKLARDLDEVADVTMVDGKDAFFHRVASLRASVDPDWTTAPFFPYDRLLARGRVLRDKATGIDTGDRLVLLRSGMRLPYDALVIATGADYQEPARFTGVTVDEAATAFTEHQKQAARAGSILVVGGGPSGVELASELRRTQPGSEVTLAHSGPYLLSRAQSRRMGARAQEHLERNAVRVRLNTVITSAGAALIDQSGAAYRADLVFWTTGTTPNTLWLRLAGHGSWLNAAGHVRVDAHLRVQGHPDIFAIGDVNDVAEAKLSPSAIAQASAATYNIRSFLDRTAKHGSQPRPYRTTPLRIFSVPFGPGAGTTLIPVKGHGLAVLGHKVTDAVKSRHLAVPYVARLLNQPVP
ncbi:FAD-dependent oxidoreductase [Streptomyces sp. J2-1]|uniref:NAD(P)/FAD-dependent oxidoreductase n=1 Tax=Streptomyces corallincola TaxID=2851888 RepID=UPI001C391B99|nr:FAD-dependent oxidoreductase [Streptomyces corallincola]MBV2353837.1 FAD-dependent oxidoreductase [Streptomyces corallincola]